MSAKRIIKDDAVHELITNMAQFENMKHHLLTTDFDVFIRWFDKLRIIEPRATYLFIKEHRDEFTDQEILYVNNTYDFLEQTL